MTPQEGIALVGVSTSVIIAVTAGMSWVIKAQVRGIVDDLGTIKGDLKPNGGGSVKDQLNRIERDVIEVRHKVDDHIEWHLDR